jgi:hypothetical protein
LLCSYNDYLPKITEPVVILLNNDIRVEPDFIGPLLAPFAEDASTFLVAPRVMTFDGKTIESGRSVARVRFGIFECTAHYPGFQEEALRPSETFSAGFGAFSREKFLALGGYDELFLPGIMEDVDLCHRARKAGYGLWYEPRSVLYHIGQATFKKRFGVFGLRVLAHRNNFLFMWKNFSGHKFWLTHLIFLPLRLLFPLLKGKPELLVGFLKAVKKRME